MKHFIVKVEADLPYPINREYRIDGAGFRPAVGRAIKMYRKDERIKGKKIKALRVKAIMVGENNSLKHLE